VEREFHPSPTNPHTYDANDRPSCAAQRRKTFLALSLGEALYFPRAWQMCFEPRRTSTVKTLQRPTWVSNSIAQMDVTRRAQDPA